MLYYISIIIIITIIYLFSNQIKGNMVDNNNIVETVNQQNIVNPENDRIIVKFKGNRYDITDFIRKHPGGKSVLIENNGNDIEDIMLENEHSTHAYKTLERYRIIE